MTVWDKPAVERIQQRYSEGRMNLFLAIDWHKHQRKFAIKFPDEETAAVVAYLQYTTGRYDGAKRSAKTLYNDLRREWKKYNDSGRPRRETTVIDGMSIPCVSSNNRDDISDDEYTMAPYESDN
jgi:hypothetical protein